jgi:ureidoglycolate lyase
MRSGFVAAKSRRWNLTRIVRLKVEPFAEDSYAPFGELLQPKDRTPDPDMSDPNTDVWRAAFDLGATTAMMIVRDRYRGLQCSKLERHFSYGQTFVWLNGSPAVVAVAAPTNPDKPEDIPGPNDVRAFLIEGSAGYVVHPGVWHSAGRFPLYPPFTDFLLITARPGAPSQAKGQVPKQPTQVVDYSTTFGITFELSL